MISSRTKSLPAERISRAVFYVLVALIAVMFGLFYLVGYDNPYYDNPDFNAPVLSGALVVFAVAFVAVAFAVWLCALMSGLRKRGFGESVVNGIPTRRISYGVAACTVTVAVAAFVFGSTSFLTINGETYECVFWLKVADMFINTILAMLVLAVASVVFGATRYIRRKG